MKMRMGWVNGRMEEDGKKGKRGRNWSEKGGKNGGKDGEKMGVEMGVEMG